MHRNAVAEVGAETKKILLNKKVRLGWQICKTDDYLTATRCFKLSKFNHMTQDCRWEVTCPLCAGPQTLKQCKGDPTTFKCTNYENYNRQPDKEYQRKPLSSRQKMPKFTRSIREKRTEHRILNGRLAH